MAVFQPCDVAVLILNVSSVLWGLPAVGCLLCCCLSFEGEQAGNTVSKPPALLNS